MSSASVSPVILDTKSKVKTKTGQIFFTPDYTTGNKYQTNLYSSGYKFGFTIKPIVNFDLESLASGLDLARKNIFHQHWIKEYYWDATTFESGVEEVIRRISIIKALKAFGVKVVWTLHNLIDHDASDLQRRLCIYTHKEVAKVSDIIFVHTRNSVDLLSEQCGIDLKFKCTLLEHSLYDNSLSEERTEVPKEISLDKLVGKKLLVNLGMIRPYKGVADLLIAFGSYVRANPKSSLYLIVGGKVSDKNTMDALSNLDDLVKEKLILIDRRLSETEMSTLLRMAHASITPYKKILISGSFYLSTTFKKPTIAPSIGMFHELIKDGESGILYDGTRAGLCDVLRRVDEMPYVNLVSIGAANFNKNKHLTVNAVSEKYFNLLGVADE
jgi:glycosyltransferase involved in cell wall biosynthesis